MAMDDLHTHPQARFALATDGDGRVRGYLHLVPSSRGYSLSAMRRGSETPNGLMEFLIARTTLWASPAGVEEISLNFAAFADVLRADDAAPLRMRLARSVVLRLDRVFQLERLFSFNRKFHPIVAHPLHLLRARHRRARAEPCDAPRRAAACAVLPARRPALDVEHLGGGCAFERELDDGRGAGREVNRGPVGREQDQLPVGCQV